MSEWQPLSSLPDLRGIFATAFDAPDESASRPRAAAAAAASATAATGPTPTAPADPEAVWFYTDRQRAQQGPVRASEVIRLYSLLQLHDATLVFDARSGSAGTWTRLAETPPFEGEVGPELLERSAAARTAFLDEEKKRTANEKKRKREKAAAAKGANARTTSVYISGLPLDATVDELYDVARKGGIILEDDDGTRRIKLYLDAAGRPKGDAIVKYAMPESVDLAITLLDQYVFRPAKRRNAAGESTEVEKEYVITVQKAEFTPKDKSSSAAASANGGGSDTATAKRAKPSGGLSSGEIARHRLQSSLSWSDDPHHSSKLRIVILRPLFTLAQVAAHPDGPTDFYQQLRSEVAEEIESRIGGGAAGASHRGGRGAIEKLTIFEGHPDGPAAVKFRDAQHAAICIRMMHARFFAGAQLHATYFDGKTNYAAHRDVDSKETEAEEQRRLKEFGDWIEGGGDGEEE